MTPEWDIRRANEMKKKRDAELAASQAEAKKKREISEMMPRRDEAMAKTLKNYGSIHSLLTKKAKKAAHHGVHSPLMKKLKAWYRNHGMADKAEDEPHLLELAAKYAGHPDLIFHRLALKYHAKD